MHKQNAIVICEKEENSLFLLFTIMRCNLWHKTKEKDTRGIVKQTNNERKKNKTKPH